MGFHFLTVGCTTCSAIHRRKNRRRRKPRLWRKIGLPKPVPACTVGQLAAFSGSGPSAGEAFEPAHLCSGSTGVFRDAVCRCISFAVRLAVDPAASFLFFCLLKRTASPENVSDDIRSPIEPSYSLSAVAAISAADGLRKGGSVFEQSDRSFAALFPAADFGGGHGENAAAGRSPVRDTSQRTVRTARVRSGKIREVQEKATHCQQCGAFSFGSSAFLPAFSVSGTCEAQKAA